MLRLTNVDPARSTSLARLGAIAGLAALVSACAGSNGPRRPPGKPPAPKTVTREEPGGNAHDPHRAALQRLLDAPWGRRNDKDDQIHAPTPDWENWRRVRFWGLKHFTGFRYGDDHHVMAVVVLRDIEPGEPNDSASCNKRFEHWARPQISDHDVDLGPIRRARDEWRDHRIIKKWVDGSVAWGLKRHHFSAAWASYPAYPDACLTYAVAVPWREQGDLARAVRDRWLDEGFKQMWPLTEKRPHRK